MSRRPAAITQADVARAIRAARQTGAAEVEIRIDGKSSIIVRLKSTADLQGPLEQTEVIVL